MNTIPELINAIRQGEMVILMDDEDRENEGDLIMAASLVRPDDINFMARFGRGLICLTLTRERCEQLKLPLMVPQNFSKQGTNFTVSIEAATGVTTGISAADRATTILRAVAADAKSADIVQPGHIFPLMSQPGGVLSRAGHTEAGSDLARLAGLEPAAVIVEILNEDGTMARRADLEKFAAEHQLKMGTIADLIEYRNLHEKTVERIASCHWPTRHGDFELVTFRDTIDGNLHFALVKGELSQDEPVLVRVHLEDRLSDLLDAQRGFAPSWKFHDAMQKIAEAKAGVLVLLANEEPTESLLKRITALSEGESKSKESQVQPAHRGTVRTIGIGSQILSDLGVRKMCLLGSPRRYTALSGFKLEVVDYVTTDE